jgi:hypothetical protein
MYRYRNLIVWSQNYFSKCLINADTDVNRHFILQNVKKSELRHYAYLHVPPDSLQFCQIKWFTFSIDKRAQFQRNKRSSGFAFA